MTEPITLPGTLPGLLPRCSPVWHETEDHEDWDVHGPPLVKVRAVVGLLRFGGVLASVSYEQSGVSIQEDEVPVAELALDLEDRTGRAHAQWWLLAESIRLHKLRYPQLEAGVSDWVVLSFHWEMPPYKRLDKWRFSRFTIGRGYIWDSKPTPGRPWEHCPALGDLDPSDRTLLADGSRRVVALALQAVCLQMGGGR